MIRLDHPDGRTWVGTVTDGGGLLIKSGRGTRLRTTTIPPEEGQSSEDALLERAQKIREAGFLSAQEKQAAGVLYVEKVPGGQEKEAEITALFVERFGGLNLPHLVARRAQTIELGGYQRSDAVAVWLMALSAKGLAKVVDDEGSTVEPYPFLKENGFLEDTKTKALAEKLGLLPVMESLQGSNTWFI